MEQEIIWFKDCSYKNKHLVGGKCSSLGELHAIAKRIGFSIGDGFAISTELYNKFVHYNNLEDTIVTMLNDIDVNNIDELETKSLKLRQIIAAGKLSEEHESTIIDYYHKLSKIYGNDEIEVAIRSSALAEDLPNASFAGQHDTYLNITGPDNVIQSIKECFASLFNSRAISYRQTHNIDFNDVKISVAVQKMIRSDIGSAGVAFSLDPETGDLSKQQNSETLRRKCKLTQINPQTGETEHATGQHDCADKKVE